MSYADIVICVEPDWILEIWPTIYRGHERPARDKLRLSQLIARLFSPCFTFRLVCLIFNLRVYLTPFFPILSPLSRTFAELTLFNWCRPWGIWALEIEIEPIDCPLILTMFYVSPSLSDF
jgi:hypothetical protein